MMGLSIVRYRRVVRRLHAGQDGVLFVCYVYRVCYVCNDVCYVYACLVYACLVYVCPVYVCHVHVGHVVPRP